MIDQFKDVAENGLEMVVHAFDPTLSQKTNNNNKKTPNYPEH